MRPIIVGCGYTGRRLLEQLPEAIGLNRSVVNTAADCRVFDIDSAKMLPELPAERLQVVYTVPPPAVGVREPRLARFLGLLNDSPERVVYLSTSSVYSDSGTLDVDEATGVNPDTDRGHRRVAAEHLLRQWCRDHDTDLAILRVPGIYGPGRLGLERIEAGDPIIAENEATPGNRIHVDDLVECCIAALSADAGIYNVSDGDHRSSSWFRKEVARQAGLPLPPEIGREAAKTQFSAKRWSFLANARRISTEKMHTELGVIPRYRDASNGIRASLAASTARD